MNAANFFRIIATRIVPLSLLSITVILAAAPPALAATKLGAPERVNTLGNSVRASPTASSQSSPAAAGQLRILLVDDDVSDNNNIPGDSRKSVSDTVFRKLASDAVGGDAASWAIETVKTNANGPSIDKLRNYSLIIWYTGASYGGNPDNTSVLSIQDEKTVRRYLEESGGAVILVSPGYASKVLEQGSTWEESAWPFLKEVLGIRGGKGLAQRFEPGTVTTTQGTQFQVGKGGAVESQFSAVNPGGAAAVFTAELDGMKSTGQPTPVATATSYGRGRIVYVGFTFENLAGADLAPAFKALLAAAGPQANPAMGATTQEPMKRRAADSDSGQLTVQVSGTPASTTVSWTLPAAPIVNASILGPGQSTRKAAAPAPGPTVTADRWVKSTGFGPAPHWQRMVVQPGASQVVDIAAVPGSEQRYRLTVTAAGGATEIKEVQYNVPPVKEPESLSANVQSDGSIILSWPEVPGVTKYRVQYFVLPGRNPHVGAVVDGATEWRSPPLDGTKRHWVVSSLYERNGEYVSLSEQDSGPVAITEGADQYYLTTGKFTIHTGTDNKEILSGFEIKLYINGGETQPEDSANPNPHRLQYVGHSFGSRDVELKVNSSADFKLSTSVDTVWAPQKNNLANIQQHGLRIVIKYLPNFFLDAWKVDKVTLTVSFQNVNQLKSYARTGHRYFSPEMENRTITFPNVARLLTESGNQIDLITDGSLQPIGPPN